jgi:hypothetical protein
MTLLSLMPKPWKIPGNLIASHQHHQGNEFRMSKALYAYSRHDDFNQTIENRLAKICEALTPDNVNPASGHKIRVRGKTAYAVTLNNSALHEADLSLLLGCLYEQSDTNWSTPGFGYPDGNYAIFRHSDEAIEVVSDGAGSRTIWYYQDDDLFVASTSQRAIILFLGAFVFDESVIPWLLSTGSLGPRLSWDKRFRRLPADASVLLDKNTWALSVNQNPIVFSEANRTDKAHKEQLAGTIRQTVKQLESLDFNRWLLPLSGGYDSRAILCFIKEQIGIPDALSTVTWGLESSLAEDNNDAKIARELARSLGVQHEYHHTDLSPEPLETIIDRFLLCGEGRIDHLSGYMDGMEIWRKFHDDNITGVIRGDEGFGWSRVSSELTVRLSVGCALCTDFENLKNIVEDFGLPAQQLPAEFEKADNESLSAWRDRLYHAYRIPTILAALSDIKFSYVEQINPLLSKAILSIVRTMPDALRTDKFLFKEIVNTIGPGVPFATRDANADPKNILRTKSFVNLLKSEISSSHADRLLGPEFIKFILDGIREETPASKARKPTLKENISSLLPKSVKNWLRDKALSARVDGNVLAFRVFILLRMHKTFQADAAALSS